MFVAMAPVLVPVAIWVYTLVFAFSALWFAHYLLSALALRRAEQVPAAVPERALPSVRVPSLPAGDSPSWPPT